MMPDRQLSIAESAVLLHEIFVSLQHAGFTHAEAMELIGRMLAASQSNPSTKPDEPNPNA